MSTVQYDQPLHMSDIDVEQDRAPLQGGGQNSEKASQKKSEDEPVRTVIGRSIKLNGHATSISLEAEFWEALREIAQDKGLRLGQLAGQIDAARVQGGMSSALRVFVLEHFRSIWEAKRQAAAQAATQLSERENGVAP